MPSYSIPLARHVSDHLDDISRRLGISSAELLGLILARLVEVDQSWRSSGMAGITPNRIPEDVDPGRQEPEAVLLTVEVSDDVAEGYRDICSRLGASHGVFLTMLAKGLVDQDTRLVSKGRGGAGHLPAPWL
jgi:hypothetical protein